MRFGKRAIVKDQADKAEQDRQKMLTYKRVFGGEDGRTVLFDLCNRYHVLNSHGGDHLKEGQRSVVLDILTRCHVDMAEFDKILSGDLG